MIISSANKPLETWWASSLHTPSFLKKDLEVYEKAAVLAAVTTLRKKVKETVRGEWTSIDFLRTELLLMVDSIFGEAAKK